MHPKQAYHAIVTFNTYWNFTFAITFLKTLKNHCNLQAKVEVKPSYFVKINEKLFVFKITSVWFIPNVNHNLGNWQFSLPYFLYFISCFNSLNLITHHFVFRKLSVNININISCNSMVDVTDIITKIPTIIDKKSWHDTAELCSTPILLGNHNFLNSFSPFPVSMLFPLW